MKKMRKSILISSIIVTIITIIIKFLGILKHSIIASKIGATFETDAFYIATGVIGQLAIMIFSALSITLLSFYAEKKEQNGYKDSNELINSSLIFFMPISCIISLLCYIFAPYIAEFLAPSYENNALMTLTYYIKIMSFAFIPCCYNIILNVILENEKIFIPGRSIGLLQNLFVIIAVILLYNTIGMSSAVYAFLFSNIVQATVITISALKIFKFKIPKYYRYRNEIKKILLVAIPLIIGNTVYEINDIVDKQIAAGLGEGAASMLTYGATLNEIVTGVIVASISVVLFANFTTLIARKQIDKIEKNFILVMDLLVMIIIPIIVMCLVCGKEIVTLFYGHGQLTENNLLSVNMVLVGYAIGFIFQAFRANLIKILYAFKDTKSTMINGIISISFNIVLSIFLSKLIGLAGISLATSISVFVATMLLYISAKKYLPNLLFKKVTKGYYKYFIAGIISFIPVYYIHSLIKFNYFVNLCINGIFCIFIYLSILIIMKANGLQYFRKKIFNIMNKRSVREDINF